MSENRKQQTKNRPGTEENEPEDLNKETFDETSIQPQREKLESPPLDRLPKKTPIQISEILKNYGAIITFIVLIAGFIIKFWISIDGLNNNDKDIITNIKDLKTNTNEKINNIDQKIEKIRDDVKDIKYYTETIKDNTYGKK